MPRRSQNIFSKPKYQYTALWKERARTGSYETRTQLRGRKPILTEKQHQDILELVQKQPDITMKEIIESLNLPVGSKAVRRFLIKQGYTYKKKSLHAKNRSVPDVQAKRSAWIETYLMQMQNIRYILMKAALIQTSQDTMHVQYMGNVPLMLPQ